MAHLLRFSKINVSGYTEIAAINVDKIERIEEIERRDADGMIVKCCNIYLPNCNVRVVGSLNDLLKSIKCGKDFIYD